MKGIALLGVVLVLLGIGFLGLRQVSFTTEKPVVAVGPITASVAETHSIAFPNIAAFGAIAAGLVLVVVGYRKA
jgi:hypothetical protein